MCRFVAVGCAIGLLAISAMAADYPKAEIFGGYQFTHLEGGPNASGWNFAVNGNFNATTGITADFSSAYASQNGVNYSNYTYTFGPVLSLRTKKNYTPFVHALIGGDHASAGVAGLSVSGNGFALMAGGGVDANLNRRFAVRVAQADWFLVHGSGGTSGKNFRLSFGIVARF
jgi:hypothetical protein